MVQAANEIAVMIKNLNIVPYMLQKDFFKKPFTEVLKALKFWASILIKLWYPNYRHGCNFHCLSLKKTNTLCFEAYLWIVS